MYHVGIGVLNLPDECGLSDLTLRINSGAVNISWKAPGQLAWWRKISTHSKAPVELYSKVA